MARYVKQRRSRGEQRRKASKGVFFAPLRLCARKIFRAEVSKCDLSTFVQSWLRSKSASEFEALGNRLFRLCAYKTVDEFAVFEDEHGGYTGDLKMRSCLRVLVNVQFNYSISPL